MSIHSVASFLFFLLLLRPLLFFHTFLMIYSPLFFITICRFLLCFTSYNAIKYTQNRILRGLYKALGSLQNLRKVRTALYLPYFLIFLSFSCYSSFHLLSFLTPFLSLLSPVFTLPLSSLFLP